MRRFRVGLFGDEGFFLQRLDGNGIVVIKGGGSIIKKNLREGEVLRAVGGSIMAFQTSVKYDLQMVKGLNNMILGGEGLFFAELTGPGCVFLQSLPFGKIIENIQKKVSKGK